MQRVQKLKRGDKVAILSPSFAAPEVFPHVYELGLERLRSVFGLDPVEYPSTRNVGASTDEKMKDFLSAVEDDEVRAIIATIGGDEQVTYVHKISKETLHKNPKLFFGYSDNSHLCNALFLSGVPSFYGGCLMTQFAMQGEMDEYTIKYLKYAFFDSGNFDVVPSDTFNEVGLDWNDESLLDSKRSYVRNPGWLWDGCNSGEGLLWGGCLESIDDMLRNDIEIPTLNLFDDIVLILETSEEMPPHHYVHRVLRGLGQRGILNKVNGVLVGRPKAWEFHCQRNQEERNEYRSQQNRIILSTIREYNKDIPIVQNLDFGHTDPQVPMPYGSRVRINSQDQTIVANF